MFEGPPAVCACFERGHFVEVASAIAAQVVFEEWEQDMFLKPKRSGKAEVGLTKFRAVIAGPLTVEPGAHHKTILDIRVLFFDCGVGCKRAVEIFSVIPTADGKYGRLDILQVGK